MTKYPLSRSRTIDLVLLLLVISVLGVLGWWWRQREWQKYLDESANQASGAVPSAGTAPVASSVASLADKDPVVRARAIDSLVARPAEALPLLITALDSDDVLCRKNAAMTLGRMGPLAAPALESLCRSLEGDDHGLLEEVLIAIKRIGMNSEEHIAAVTRQLERDQPSIRGLALEALAVAGSAAVPTLTTALKHSDRDTRIQAAIELGQIDPDVPEIIPVLLDALRTGRKPLLKDRRETVATILVSLGDRATAGLIEMLGDEAAAANVANLLAAMRPPPKAAIPSLIKCLRNKDRWVQQGAVSALKVFGKEAEVAVQPLYEVLNEIDDWSCRVSVCQAVIAMDSDADRVVSMLVKQLREDKNKNVRREVATLLGQLGERAKPAIPALMTAMNSDEDHVQIQAALALWRITSDAEMVLATQRWCLREVRGLSWERSTDDADYTDDGEGLEERL